MHATLVLGNQGRIVVPAELRRRMGLQPGDELAVSVERGALVLRPAKAAADALFGMFAHIEPERSLVDELIAERRAAAAAGE